MKAKDVVLETYPDAVCEKVRSQGTLNWLYIVYDKHWCASRKRISVGKTESNAWAIAKQEIELN